MGTSEKPLKSRVTTWFSRNDWQARIITFNASWYTLTMGTGGLAQVYYYFPYQAQWLRDIGYCFWVLTMVLFLFFTAMSMARAYLHPKLTADVFKDFYQTSFLGAIPITIDTIAVPFVLYHGTHPGTIYFAYALYWVAVFMSIFVGGVVIFIVTAVQEPPELESVQGIWLLSFIPMLVTSATGGAIVPHLAIEARAATLVVSFGLWGIGLTMSFVITTIYFWRLVQVKLPARDAIVSCFVPMGPYGMGSYSIQNLVVALQSYLTSSSYTLQRMAPSTMFSSAITADGRLYHQAVAHSIHWIGILIAILLSAFSTFWLFHATFAVFYRVPKQFNTGHWSFVFPNVVYTLGFIMLGEDLDNNGFRGWATCMAVICTLLWLYCTFGTLYTAVWKGKVMYAPGLEGWAEKKTIEEEIEERRHKSDELLEPGAPKVVNSNGNNTNGNTNGSSHVSGRDGHQSEEAGRRHGRRGDENV